MNRLLLLAVCLLPFGEVLQAAEPAPVAPPPVIQILRKEIALRPSRVLIAVEDALTMDERAVCEIITAAIAATRADPRLVGEIVYTALKQVPSQAAKCVECASNAAPDAVAEIQQAMEKALGKAGAATRAKQSASPAEEGTPDGVAEQPATGKGVSGKEPAGVAAVEPGNEEGFMDSFLPGSVGVGGIYLIVPARSSGVCRPGNPCCSGSLSPSCLKP